MENKNSPAFPATDLQTYDCLGLTKREYYAGIALQALISKLPLADREGEFSEKHTQEYVNNLRKDVCESAINYADELLKQLDQ